MSSFLRLWIKTGGGEGYSQARRQQTTIDEARSVNRWAPCAHRGCSRLPRCSNCDAGLYYARSRPPSRLYTGRQVGWTHKANRKCLQMQVKAGAVET